MGHLSELWQPVLSAGTCRGIAVFPEKAYRAKQRQRTVRIVSWLPEVKERSEAFWAPVRAWYAYQAQQGHGVRVYGEREPARKRGHVQWQWPPAGFRQPVWGWRGVLIAYYTRKWLRRKGSKWWVAMRTYHRMGEVLKARRRWSSSLTRQVERDLAQAAAKRERRARPMQMQITSSGLVTGWRRP